MAIDALQNGQIPNAYQASRIYRVNYNTLKCCMNGRAYRADTLANGRNLDYNEEALLIEWILDFASRGFPPRKWMVEDTVNIILLSKNKKLVGKKWF